MIPTAVGLYSEETWQAIVPVSAAGLWLGINIVYLIVCVFASLSEKSAYGKAIRAYDMQSESLETYYTSIANDYNVTGTDRANKNPAESGSIKSFQAVLQNYERLHNTRAIRKAGGKSWLSLLLLCMFLGWMGAHRFYVGKIGTGILMLVTLPSGISLIWAIIDLVLIFSGKFTDSKGKVIRL
jgi:hypothetical protein